MIKLKNIDSESRSIQIWSTINIGLTFMVKEINFFFI